MRELRISLPTELWDKFPGQSPQQMKSAILTVICLQFQVTPEPKKRKQSLPRHQHRGKDGLFAEKPCHGVPSRGHEIAADVGADVQPVPRITQEPQTLREITAQVPQPLLEIAVQHQESQPAALLESKSVVAKPIKIHSAYAVGLRQ